MLKRWLSLYAFHRAITIYNPCAEETGSFVPESTCLDERSRIVGGYLVRDSVDLSTLVDADAVADAIEAGDMRIVKGLAGNWALGTSNKKPGMGFNSEKHSTFTYAIPIKHYSVDANLAFWNAINKQVGWSMLFVFEDLSVWGALDQDKKGIPMDIVMAPASEEDLGSNRRFEGTCGWRGDLPYVLTSPVVGAFTKVALSATFK